MGCVFHVIHTFHSFSFPVKFFVNSYFVLLTDIDISLKYLKYIPAVHSLESSSYPSAQSGAPSHKYWIEIQAPFPGHLKGSYGWHGSSTETKKKKKFQYNKNERERIKGISFQRDLNWTYWHFFFLYYVRVGVYSSYSQGVYVYK